MRNEGTQRKQLWAWLAVSMSAPLAHFSGGSWLTLLLLGVVCWGATALTPESWDGIQNRRILCLVELIWFVMLLGQMMSMSAAYWPGRKSEIVVPLVLLALAAYSCGKHPCRVAGVLFWILMIMYIPVLVAGAKDVELAWLIPESMELDLQVIPVLLLPCAAKVLGVGKKSGGWYPGILLFEVSLWLITAGVLSPGVAAEMETPFRELSRSLTIGAASRFESLISVAITLGWFSFACILLQSARTLLMWLGVKGKYAPWLAAVVAFGVQMTGIELSGVWTAIITVIAWILMPMLSNKKDQKT